MALAPWLGGCLLDWASLSRNADTDSTLPADEAAAPDGPAPPRMDVLAREAAAPDVLPLPDSAAPDVPAPMPDEPAMDAADVTAPSPDVPAPSPDAPTVDVVMPPPDAPCVPGPGHLLLNELQVAPTANKFVELYNPTRCAVALGGYVLRYRSASGASVATIWTGSSSESIAASGFFVLAYPGFPGTANGTLTGFALAATGGGVALFVTAADTTPADSVGYGTATNAYVRGTAAPAPPSGESIGRMAGVDTGNNQADFRVIATPTPGAPN